MAVGKPHSAISHHSQHCQPLRSSYLAARANHHLNHLDSYWAYYIARRHLSTVGFGSGFIILIFSKICHISILVDHQFLLKALFGLKLVYHFSIIYFHNLKTSNPHTIVIFSVVSNISCW